MKDMDRIRVALLQLHPTKTLQGNLEKGLAACQKAKEMGADIALFPEMWSCGYDIYDRPAHVWTKDAICAESDFVCAFGRLAAQLDMAIGITLLEDFSPAPRNTLVLFDRHGQKALTYAKVHTCDFGVERALTPGEDLLVTELDTAAGPVKVGAMICYDREFPESARILMLKGAELILVPNACPMEINRIAQLRARAFENMVGIATCNYPADHPDCNGHSTAFDGIAYMDGVPGSLDTLILDAGEAEGIYVAAFPLSQMRKYRENEVHGNSYRRPEKYRLLLSTDKHPPFVRDDYRQ